MDANKNNPELLNQDLSPLTKEPQHLPGAPKGPSFDFEMGFEVHKLGKSDAAKVASMLTDRLSLKIGTR